MNGVLDGRQTAALRRSRNESHRIKEGSIMKRLILKTSALSSLGLIFTIIALMLVVQPDDVMAGQKLKFQAAWPSSLSNYKGFEMFVDHVNVLSNGRLEIKALPGGTVVPGNEVLGATARRVIDGGWFAAAYSVGKNKAAALFGPAPAGSYGLDWRDYLGWIYYGGGLELHHEFYQDVMKMDVVAFPLIAVPNQPLGWFNREVKGWDDMKGIKCRNTGLGGELMKPSGMLFVNLPGGEIIPASERGILDCAEWAAPAIDRSMGFEQVFKYLYMGSMHETSTVLELLINGKVWRSLTPDLQQLIKTVTVEVNFLGHAIDVRQNAEALAAFKKAGVTVKQTPQDILENQLKVWDKMKEEIAAKNPFFKKVLASQREYASIIVPSRRTVDFNYKWVADHYWPEN